MKPKKKSNWLSKKCFIVAEISANHDQNFGRAVKMIKKAKECGADAVKFQTYTPESLTINVNNKYFQLKHPNWGGYTLFELYKKTYTPWHWFKKLKMVAEDVGITFFSTAFDKKSVDFLENLDVPFHKISSFELNDTNLIDYIARSKKPLILSTGMANISEIKEAIDTAKAGGTKDIILLKCVSSYPADPREMNLRTIPHMCSFFRLPIGLSDHTLGTEVATASISMGATLVEKHFTLSRKKKTPDSFFSIEPEELSILVNQIRLTELALGKISYGFTKKEKKNRIFRRSLFAVKYIKKGDKITNTNIKSIRPGYGLSPKYLKNILGKKAMKSIKRGTPVQLNLIQRSKNKKIKN